MISQNRADEKRQVLADQQWTTVLQEEQQNEELLHVSNQILDLTKAIHAMDIARSTGASLAIAAGRLHAPVAAEGADEIAAMGRAVEDRRVEAHLT